MNEISALQREAHVSLAASGETQWKGPTYEPGQGSSLNSSHAGPLILDSSLHNCER